MIIRYLNFKKKTPLAKVVGPLYTRSICSLLEFATIWPFCSGSTQTRSTVAVSRLLTPQHQTAKSY